ncbi:Diguanylate cyclase [Rubrivivax sp. A210]|uniref:GGDEF domain-containing protein n=1 Tax=Rubrivivax sp. A210 TaxID=2772301 RepID=UPI00191B306F|nr:diguanylate cyclase [Rubrivivax sp. A210]CAD5374500.1 Diguanylate cyclase [Rubrivivax sp. A210]
MTLPVESPAFGAAVKRDLSALLGSAFESALAARGELLSVKDQAGGRYLHVNEAMAVFIGCPVGEIIGRSDAELFDAPLATALRAAELTAQAQNEPLLSEHRLEWRGNRREFEVLRIVGAVDGNGHRWLCCIWSDLAGRRQREAQLRAALEQIEQQQRANDQLRREIRDQALREPLSGLHRRSHFEDQLRREVDLSTREHREFAIVFIQIDPAGAKARSLGSAGDDRVLEAMGRLLRGGTRAMDASCHYEAQRFAVLLSGVGLATAHARMEGLRRQCATQVVVHEGQEFGFTVALGVASFPHTANTQDALTAACEAALAEARRRGGNQVTLAAIRFDQG